MFTVARFYGWTLSEVRSMSADDFEASSKVMLRLEAREQLLAINAATYPHAKKGWQDKYHKMVHKSAMPPKSESVGDSMSTEDLARLMGKGGG